MKALLLPVARFEARYHLRQPLFWIVASIFFLLSFGAVSFEAITVGSGGNVHKNGPYALSQLQIVWSIFFLFVCTAFVANAVVRDDETGFAPLIRATQLRKSDYLLGRFLGAFVVVVLCFASVPAGAWIGSLMPWVDPATLGPNRLGDYLWPLAVFALPTLFALSAAFFALATATRSMMASYLGVVAVFVLYLAAGVFLDKPEHAPLFALLEPFGGTAHRLATKYWTPIERNTLLPDFTGLLLYNRLIWTAVGLGLLALSRATFRFEAPSTRRNRRGERKGAFTDTAPRGPATALPSFGARTSWAQSVARCSFELKQVLFSPALPILLALGLCNAILSLWNASERYGTQIHPVTRVMIETLGGAFGIVPLIVAIYYAGELVWRERDRRMAPIVDATPVPSAIFVLSKSLALCAVLGLLLLASAGAAVAVQALKGHDDFELGKYALWYLLPHAIDWSLLAILAVFLQTLAPNKVAGWGLMALYLISTMVLSRLGFEHHLYQYGSGPGEPLSDMNGRGDFGAAADWFRLYWSAFAVFLLAIAHARWRRGLDAGGRLRTVLRNPVAAVALVIFVATGAWIFLNTNVWNQYRTSDEEEARLAEMEKELLPFEKLQQPTITDVKLSLDLHPHQPLLTSTGSYLLENRTDAPLREVHVRFDPDLQVPQIEVEGASLEKSWDRFGYRIFRFEPPLAPGEKRTLTFTAVKEQKGFRNRDNTTRLVDNGTFLNHTEFSPSLGIDRRYLLDDRVKRRKYGLREELRPLPLEDESARGRNYLRADWVDADITVTTDADQTPIAPGYKVSDVTTGGRRTARFVTEAPILRFFSVQSAAYEVESETYRGVELSVFHDPAHRWNSRRMIDALKAGLDYFQAAFGPYQFRQARVLEFPDYAEFAQSFANTMPYSEGLGFVADFRDPERIDYVTYITAHELAHQWWGHQVVGAETQGATMLSETLAQYSALMVMKRLYGEAQMRKFLSYERDEYLRGRGREKLEELPLVRVENQPYIHYEKGSLAMYQLQDRIGEERVNRALRKLVERYAFRGPPFATSLDLVEALRAEAGPENQALITDLFERITLYDLRLAEAAVTKRDDGRFDVSLSVDAHKFYADGTGRETEAPIDAGELFDVGLFLHEPGTRDFTAADVLRVDPVHLASGSQQLTLTVDREPRFAGIDPWAKQLDRKGDDNLLTLDAH